MRSHRTVAAAVAGVALAFLLGWNAFVLRAADEGEEHAYVSNPLTDCSTNPGFRDSNRVKAIKEVGGPIAQNTSCASCHKNTDHPQVTADHRDRPEVGQAAVVLQNRTDKPITFQVRFSARDSKWKEVTLEPNKVSEHVWKYGKDRQGQSPYLQVKYEGDPYDKVRQLVPMATPNKHLGAVYFFDAGKDNQVRIFEPGSTVARGRR